VTTPTTPPLVVIGSGVAGASTAFALARRSASVTVTVIDAARGAEQHPPAQRAAAHSPAAAPVPAARPPRRIIHEYLQVA
jgi:glycine/D-amino acid oxidase-like deaminating enzyme